MQLDAIFLCICVIHCCKYIVDLSSLILVHINHTKYYLGVEFPKQYTNITIFIIE